MKNGLSPAQRRAVAAAAGETLVAAAAGSGKTLVLAEHFLRQSARGTPVDRIAAIAFTQKAANVLKSRLSAAAESFVTGRSGGYVGTIDGFCRKLLREYAVDAGVDPDFSVLDNDVATLVLEEAVGAVFDAVSPEPRFEAFFARYGIERLGETLRGVYHQWVSQGTPLRAAPLPPETGRDYETLGAEAGRLLAELGSDGNADAAARAIAAAKPDRIGAEEFGELTRHLAALEDKFTARRNATKETVLRFREVIEEMRGILADGASAPHAQLFLELLAKLDAEYGRRKSEMRCLDFSDLLRRAIGVFDEPLAAERIRAGLDLVLVDEYQDINPLQAEFIEKISGLRRVFCVGDVRQSIYRFRHADCGIFLKKARAGQSGKIRLFPLDENYRARAEIVEFINRVFESAPAAADHPFGRMKPVRAARSAPCIELLVDRRPEKSVKADRIPVTAVRVARRIRAMIEDPRFLIEPAGKAPRRVRYGDIAILFPKMTDVDFFERALRAQRVPYHLVKGKGFYHKSEVDDVLNLLAALADPLDEIALLSCMKSPFGGLTDDALTALRRHAEPACPAGRDPEHAAAAMGPEDAERFVRFRRWFDRLRENRHRLGVSEIIENAIQPTHYDAYLLGLEEGTRRYLNLMKLRDKAAVFDRFSGGGLRRFIGFVHRMRDREIRESEAVFESEKGDAVKVLTVHSAKGLEFPVVFVAGIESGIATDRAAPFILDRGGEIFGAFPGPRGSRLVKGRRYREATKRAAELDREEHGRLFYVALTRAMEYLVLAGAVKEKPSRENPSWADRLKNAIPALSGPEQAGPVEWNGLSLLIDDGIPTGEAAVGAAEPFFTQNLKALAGPPPAGPPPRPVLSAGPPPYYQTLDLSVSELLEFKFGARGAPAAAPASAACLPAGRAGGTPGPRAELTAAEYGDLFHRLMQHADFAAIPERECARLLRDYAPGLSGPLRASIEKAAGSFLSDPRIAGIRAAFSGKAPFYRELPFLLRVAKEGRDLGFLRGQCDLLCRNKDGWVLFDYKTGAAADEHLFQMRIYAHALTTLLGEAIAKAVLYYAEEARFVEVPVAGCGSPAFERELTDLYEMCCAEALGRSGGGIPAEVPGVSVAAVLE